MVKTHQVRLSTSSEWQVEGDLKVGSLAIAPHVADPRLAHMRCTWKPWKTPYCGIVGKVIEVDEHSVKLYCCGKELWWDIKLFDACMTRYCHSGCDLQQRVVDQHTVMCDVCSSRLPLGAETRWCEEHGYSICSYCLGHKYGPLPGDRVIPGPTWTDEMTYAKGQEDYYDEGTVETRLLDATSILEDGIDMSIDESNKLLSKYHTWFRVSWKRSGQRCYYRGPPFQDVMPAFSNGLKFDPQERRICCFWNSHVIKVGKDDGGRERKKARRERKRERERERRRERRRNRHESEKDWKIPFGQC